MTNQPNTTTEIAPADAPRGLQYFESVDSVNIENLRRSWQQIDSGAKVGVMRNMEFSSGGRTKRYVNSSAYHRTFAAKSVGKP